MASHSPPPYGLSLNDSLPLIVRISGIPSDVLTGFSSPTCLKAEHRLCALKELSEAARAALVQQLYTVIQEAPPAQRHNLIALKRDSFNGRDLLGYRNHPRWSDIAQLVGPLAEYTLIVEEGVENCRREFLKVYESQRSREQQHLKKLIGARSLLSGLALGSPEFIINLPRFLRASPERLGRRERRLEMSSLRYVSRAAIKLSPFSSLTPIGLARLFSGVTPKGALQFCDVNNWHEHCKIHLQRFLVDQIASLLVHHEPFRAGLTVKLNSTIDRLDKGACRFLRPGSWACSPEGEILERQQPSLVRAKLGGPIFDYLSEYGGSGKIYRDLLADLVSEFPGYRTEVLRESLDRLLRIGFLCFDFPWAKPVADSEVLLMEYLDHIEGELLESLKAKLRRLIDILRSYGELPYPAQEIVECRMIIQGILTEASKLVGKYLQVENDSKEWFFHEDVLLTSGRPTAEILRVPSAKIQKILDEMNVLVRLSNLGHSRFDYMHTLYGFAAAQWPDAQEISFLEFFEAAFPIFRQYVSFDRKTRLQWPLRRETFNPMNLQEIEQLRLYREWAAQGLNKSLVGRGLDVEVDLDRVRGILDNIPEHYTEPRDFSVFVQPLEPAGDSWVLNALVEGAGRFESRYTMVMPPEIRQDWSSRYVARSTFDPGSGRAEIVDLFSPVDNTANLHVPLTRRVIEFPGQPTGLSPEQTLLLRNLRVRFDGAGRLPWLVDDQGRRLLPTHLGAQGFKFLPSIQKFLALFGSWELRPSFPVKDLRQVGDVRVRERHWIGSVIYRRRAWVCMLGSLKAEIAGQSEAAAFQKISLWRRTRNLPDRVFIADPVLFREERSLIKPQYIDFTSCLFVDIFINILEKSIEHLEIVEALPGPEDGLVRGSGECWATEFQLDAHGLTPFNLYSSHSGKSAVALKAR